MILAKRDEYEVIKTCQNFLIEIIICDRTISSLNHGGKI